MGTKISALTALTTVVVEDFFVVVDTSATTTKKVSAGNHLMPIGKIDTANSDGSIYGLFNPNEATGDLAGSIQYDWAQADHTKIELVERGYDNGEVYSNWVTGHDGTTKTAYQETGAEDDAYNNGVFARQLATIHADGTAQGAFFQISTYGTETVGILLEAGSAFLDISETVAPTATANHARLYCVDNGGKTELLVRFGSGGAIRLAIEA